MTTSELVAKFRHNADGAIPAQSIDRVVDAVLNLEAVSDVGTIMAQLGNSAS